MGMSTVYQDQNERRHPLGSDLNKVCPKRSIMQGQHIPSIGDLHAPFVHAYRFLGMMSTVKLPSRSFRE